MFRKKDYEAEALELERRADELESLQGDDIDFASEAARLREEARGKRQAALAKLKGWQALQLARIPTRPSPAALMDALLGQQREHASGAIGVGELAGRPVICLAFSLDGVAGDALPAAISRARRAVRLAAKLKRPLITLVDFSQGEGGADALSAAAIGELATSLAELEVPTVALVTGVAIGALSFVPMIADEVLMVRYAVLGGFDLQTVRRKLCSPETPLEGLADQMVLTAERARALAFVDSVVDEPDGGAHRDPRRAADLMLDALDAALERVCSAVAAERRVRRVQRAKRPVGYEER